MGIPSLTPAALLQMLLQQQQQGQGQQPAEQMSQQGQFNPADIQAQLQGGPSIYTQPPLGAGKGQQLLNALANAGRAATYVAEDPRERVAEDSRAQQLWETKQKMALAAGEFGQREKDRQLQQQQLDVYRQAALGERRAGRESSAEQKAADRAVKMRGLGLDPDTGDPLPPDQLPPGVRSKLELNDAAEQLKQAQTNLANARTKALPDQLKNAQNAHQIALANYQLKLAQFERDTFGQVPSAMAPGAQTGPGAQPMVAPQGTLTTEGGQPTGWKSPSAPTAATKTKAQQANAVISVGKQLISEIDKVGDQLGPWSGRGQNFEQWFGSIAPQMERLSGMKGSFAALLPALHQFRSTQAMQEFEKNIGLKGFKTNAEAMKAGVQAIIDSAQTMQDAWMKQKDQPQGRTTPQGGAAGNPLGLALPPGR